MRQKYSETYVHIIDNTIVDIETLHIECIINIEINRSECPGNKFSIVKPMHGCCSVI